MEIVSFRYLCGLTVLITHILAVAFIAATTRFIDIRDQIGSILIVTPVSLVYASAFMRYVVANANVEATPQHPERLHVLPAITMFLVVTIFCLSLLYVVIRFAFFSTYRLNDFKMWLGASETAFGALIAIVFERLFGVQRSS